MKTRRSSTQGTRILIIDDHPLVRQGLIGLIRETYPEITCGEAAKASEAYPLLSQSWDMVLLDVSLPDENGFQVLEKLKELRRSLPVLIVSMHSEEHYAVRALKAGAAGFICKAAVGETLLGAIETVLEGRIYVSDAVGENLAADVAFGSDKGGGDRLSGRELEVLSMLGTGKSVKEISYDLGLSLKTIGTYRTRILNKLRLSTTYDVIRYAIQEGLVPV